MTKYVLIHINKCGGGSLYTTITKNAPGFGLTQIHTERDFSRLSEIITDADTRVFLFVRDPITRYVASFNFIRRDYKDLLIKRRFKGYFGIEYDEIPDFNQIVEKLNGNLHLRNYMGQIDPHLNANISFYLNHVSDTYLDQIKEKIVFVGTVENFAEDYDKLLVALSTDSGFTFPDDMALNHVHKTRKEGKPLSQASIDYIREQSANDYTCLQKLIDFGFLQQSYLDDMLAKTDYTY